MSDITHLKVRIQKILESTFGPSFNTVTTHLMEQMLNKDPYEMLREDPRTFNECLMKIYGEIGAKMIIRVIEKELGGYGVVRSQDELRQKIRNEDRPSGSAS
jgi:hypothetical protein